MRPRLHRRTTVAAPAFALLLLTGAAAQEAPDNRSSRADYVLRATVEPAERTLSGSALISWQNRSQDTVSDLWFHLHLNAYSNNQSTHLFESRGRLRGHLVKDGWGWQKVTSLRQGDAELIDSLAYQRPDDGRTQDYTVFSVRLAEPAAPGGTVEIELEWESMLPRVRRRTGVKDDFIFLSHWFPKLGVYEGGVGWNCHQFHMNTEFYSDYGDYDVTLDLPEEYAGKIGASGVQVDEPRVADGRVVTRFLAPSAEDRQYVDPVATGFPEPRPVIHGFAWTADPDYVRHTGTFEFSAWKERFPTEVTRAEAAFGVPLDSTSMRDVNVVVLVHPEHEGQWERHFEATCSALFFYGLWFGEYPYEQLTVVDPAWGARAAGGMEYPTLFTCGTRMFSRAQMYTPESVTVHEAGHQFWYGLVGNNEYENAWMDEGFNSFADSEALVRTYGKQRGATWYSRLPVWGVPTAAEPAGDELAGALTGQRWKIDALGVTLAPLRPSPFLDWWRDQPWLTFGEDLRDPRWGDRSGYLRTPDVDPIRTDAWCYLDRASYGTNSYRRPAVALRSLAAVTGDAAFLRGMRHYAAQWRYRHPYPEDFFASFQEGAGVDVSWYFDDLFLGTGTVDWSVEVAQWRTPEERGFFLRDGEYVEIAVADDEEDEDDVEEDAESEDGEDEGRPWVYDVVVGRKGTLRLPVSVEVTFRDGSVWREEWSREAQATSNWWRLPLPSGTSKIERVLIDPERRYYLDTDMSDNQWYAEADRVVPARWAERAYTQYAHLLHWFSSLGG